MMFDAMLHWVCISFHGQGKRLSSGRNSRRVMLCRKISLKVTSAEIR